MSDTDNEKTVSQEYTVTSRSRMSYESRLPVFVWLIGRIRGSKLRISRATAMIIFGVGVSAVVGFGAGWLGSGRRDGSLLTSSLSPQKQIVTSESQLINSIAKAVGPSVVSVNVTATAQNSGSAPGFGGGLPQSEQSAGTGIILTSGGLIITNRHVVPEGTTSVSVTLSDGTELKDVSVVGRTAQTSSLDVAFLKINNSRGEKLVPAQLGDSTKVQVGDAVVAIGNALGQFQNTVTSGIISGHGRSVQASDSGGGLGSENLDDLFQTDAAINEGNSGGPLVNMNGQVIAINTAIAGGAQNIGFAIPINDVIGLIRQVESSGKLQQPYIGVLYIPITDDVAQQYGLSVKRGAWIPPSSVVGQEPVIAGGPADKAGLKAGDIITKIDGTTIDENDNLASIIGQDRVGQNVNLTVIRDGKTITANVVLAAVPADNGGTSNQTSVQSPF